VLGSSIRRFFRTSTTTGLGAGFGAGAGGCFFTF
jgi:hypothetical protein